MPMINKSTPKDNKYMVRYYCSQRSGSRSLLKYVKPSCNKGCVTHWVLAIYMKRYINETEELWKLKIFHCAKI